MQFWDVSWTPREGDLTTEWIVRQRLGNAPEWLTLGSTRALTYRASIADTHETVDLAAVPLVNGVEGNFDTWLIVTIDPKSNEDLPALPSITNFVVAQQGGFLTARWDPINVPEVKWVEIRQCPAADQWAAGVLVARGDPRVGTASWPWMASGECFFIARLVRPDGFTYSSTNVHSSFTILDDPYMTEIASNDEAAGPWTGTKTKMEVVSSTHLALAAIPVGNAFSGAGNAQDWPGCFTVHYPVGSYEVATINAGLLVDERLEIDLAGTLYTYGGLPGGNGCLLPVYDPSDYAAPGARSYGSYLDVDTNDLLGQRIVIEIDTTPDDPTGTPTWDGWRVWVPGSTYRYWGLKIRFTVTNYGMSSVAITRFKWKRKRHNMKKEGTGTTTTAAGGDDVTFATTPRAFSAAPVVTLTPATTNANLEIVAVTATKVTVRAKDRATGAVMACDFHWHALGH